MSDDEELLAIFDQYVLPQAPAEWAGELTAEKMREAAQASSTLTRQTLLDAIQKVNDAPYTLCVGGDTHVVHPHDRNRWTNCAACARVIWVGPDPMPET